MKYRAKNYETLFKFVKVMPRILVASFFPDTVYSFCGNFFENIYAIKSLCDMVNAVYKYTKNDFVKTVFCSLCSAVSCEPRATGSSTDAEKQRVSCACLSKG